MSENEQQQPKQRVGSIGWVDLTVANAEEIRAFYESVVGWTSSPVDMGGYADHCMHPPHDGAEPVAGVCYARGPNTGLPTQWLVYVTVADVEASLLACEQLGGSVLQRRTTRDGTLQFAVIQDPGGAVMALMPT